MPSMHRPTVYVQGSSAQAEPAADGKKAGGDTLGSIRAFTGVPTLKKESSKRDSVSIVVLAVVVAPHNYFMN